ncbi:GNAT family N-acetyltransferase [Colwellia psychrerythraea]|uniref:GNAT family N-acetyltransferase n=1 Tax=Colwellia psychrerythraea TaxID=28229 RepID=UPI0002EDA7CE|nr:GNAT family N-acetyltransferase [Colwellia psychrerythraea]
MADKITWAELTKIEQLLKIIPQWEKLIKIQTTSKIFNSTSWVASWLETFWQKNWQLNVLIAWCDDELIAIVPLYYQQNNSILPMKVLYPLGQGEAEAQEISTEYTDILINEKFQEHLLPKIQQWILNLKADQLHWHALLHNSSTRNILADYEQTKSNEATRYIVNGLNWSLENLSKNMRSRYRRGLNQLDKLNATIDWVEQSDFDQYWQLMKKLHQKRWQGKNAKGAFCSDEFNQFHAKFREKSPKNIAMSAIWVNDTPIAIHYYFSDATTLYFYQSGWNESEYSHLSPGLILHLWTIENNNKPYYDFMMGKKKDSYKAKFATLQQPMYNITLTFSPIKLLFYSVFEKIKVKYLSA